MACAAQPTTKSGQTPSLVAAACAPKPASSITASQKSMAPSSVLGMPASAASCASSQGVLQAHSRNFQPV
jgi:hypothetical protein